MSGTRLHHKSSPRVTRLPKWSKTNYYPSGIIVFQNTIDSDNIDLYVSIQNHYSNDSDNSLYIIDSDGSEILNGSIWIHYASSRPLDSDNSLAAVRQRVQRVILAYDSDQRNLDSDMLWLNTVVPILPDSDQFDSDIAILETEIIDLENQTIMDFVDSEIRHRQIVVWDSDLNNYAGRTVVRTVNGIGPDADGNVPITLTRITTGPNDSLPDSDEEGAIYVVQGDSDTSLNGLSYVFSYGLWWAVTNVETEINDARFVNVSGDTMEGPLFVVTGTSPLSTVTKVYVDQAFVDKQNVFVFFDSENAIDVTQLTTETFVVTTGGGATIQYWDEINTNIIGDPLVSDYEYLQSASNVGNVITVTTLNFSNFIPGVLLLYKNGISEPFIIDSDSNAQYSTNVGGVVTEFRLLDQTTQAFEMTLINPFDLSAQYEINYIDHTGEHTIITKLAGSADWVPESERIDYGTF